MAITGYIQRFWYNTEKMNKNGMTKNYMLGRSRLLKKYWERSNGKNETLLTTEGIKSRDYFKSDECADAKCQYTINGSQINDHLEELGEVPFNQAASNCGDEQLICQS